MTLAIADQRLRIERLTTGLRKVETATAIAPHMDVEANRSVSFTVFRNGVRWLAGVSDAAT